MLVLAIGATQNGCCCPGDATATKAVVELRAPGPALSALITRCTTMQDCDPLCDAALVELFGDDVDAWSVSTCDVAGTPSGATIELEYVSNVACGRAPVGLVADRAASWLAHAAYLEAASVVAFVHLAADLLRLGAPRSLAERALVAATDEVRHARMLRAVAGTAIPRVRTLPHRPQALFALARHNAVEGCVRETLGAAINVCQARTASDPTLRVLFAAIAADEIRHAELAWDVDAWARTRLAADEAGAVDRARAAAIRALDDLVLPDDPRLGMPSRAQLAALVGEL